MMHLTEHLMEKYTTKKTIKKSLKIIILLSPLCVDGVFIWWQTLYNQQLF